jgi:CheY-like chemotaxis protein
MKHRRVELSGRDLTLGDLGPYTDPSPPEDVPEEERVELRVGGARAGWMTLGTWELLREVLESHAADGADIVIREPDPPSPAEPRPSAAPTQPPVYTSGFRQRPRRPVLVVEDDPDVRGRLVAALSRAGASCSGYPRPSAALPVLTHLRPALLVVELDLPEMSGADFARQARELLGTVRVVLLSARLPQGAMERFDDADAVFGQPLDYEAIAERASRLWRAPSADERLG